MKYDAFISYSYAEDRDLAARLKSSLVRFAKPWYQLRALRVFLDAASLAANPGLWTAIESSMRDSKRLVLLASPLSAQSEWVQKEISWWLANRSTKDMLIVLTSGQLHWDDDKNDFDWSITDCVPDVLAGKFDEEPLYVDLSWVKSADEQSIRHSKYRAAILDLAAPLRGIPKDELDSEEIRQNRRVRLLSGAAITALVILAIGATIGGITAYRQQQVAVAERIRADEQRDLAVTRELTAQARLAESSWLPTRALLLATEAVARTLPPEPRAEQALRDILATYGGTPLRHTPPDEPVQLTRVEEVVAKTLSKEDRPRLWALTDRWLVTDAELTQVALWDRNEVGPDWAPTILDVGTSMWTGEIGFSEDDNWLQVGADLLFDLSGAPANVRRFDIGDENAIMPEASFERGRLIIDQYGGTRTLYDLAPGRPEVRYRLELPDGDRIPRRMVLSPDSRWMVARNETGGVDILDLDGGKRQPIDLNGLDPKAATYAPDSSSVVLHRGGQTVLVGLPPDPERQTLLTEESTFNVKFSPGSRWLFAKPLLWPLRADGTANSPLELQLTDRDRRPGSSSHSWHFIANDKWLLNEEHGLRLWRLDGPITNAPTIEFPPGSILDAQHRWVLARPDDSRSQLVELETMRRIDLRDSPVAAASFSADGSTLVVVYDDRLVQHAELSSPESFEDLARVGLAKDLVLSRNGRLVVAGGVLIAVDPADGSKVGSVNIGVHEIAEFSDDDRWLFVRDEQSHVLHRYDLRSPRRVTSAALEGHDREIGFAYLGNDWLLTHSSTERIPPRLFAPRLWNLSLPGTGAEPTVLECDGNVHFGGFSPDGAKFAAACGFSTLVVWSLDEPQLDPQVFEVDVQLRNPPQFSDDSRWVAISGFATNLIDLESASSEVRSIECAEPRFATGSRWLLMSRHGADCLLNLRETASTPSIVEDRETRWQLDVDENLIVVRRENDAFLAYRASPENPEQNPVPMLSSDTQPAVDVSGRWLSSADGKLMNLGDERQYELQIVPHPNTYREVHTQTESGVTIEVSPNGRWAVPLRRTREGFPEFSTWVRYSWQHVFDLHSTNPNRPAMSLPEPQETLVAGFSDNRGWVSVDTDKIMHWTPFDGHDALKPTVAHDHVPGEDPKLSPAGHFILSTDEGRVHLTSVNGPKTATGRLPDYEPEGLGYFTFEFGPGDEILITRNKRQALVWRMALPADRRWPLNPGGDALDFSDDGRWLATTHAEGVAIHPLDPDVLVEVARSVAGRDLTESERLEFLRE